MKKISIAGALLVGLSFACFAQPVSMSSVFASEPQNKMAKNIPNLLMQAFVNGDIDAYYPNDVNKKIPIEQFLYHFGDTDRAIDVMTKGPSWFCSPEKISVSENLKTCFSVKFEVGNQQSQGKLKPAFVRLFFDASCNPSGINLLGPIFRFSDIQKLRGSGYQLTNLQNQAIKYSIADVLLLRLYSGRALLDSKN